MRKSLPIAVLIACTCSMALLPLPSLADWDDSIQPKPVEAAQPAQEEQEVSPEAVFHPPAVETPAQFNERKHTPQEIMAEVKLEQAKLIQAALAAKAAPPSLPDGMPIPGTPVYNQANPFSEASEHGFFDGLTREQAAQALSTPAQKTDPFNCSPDWAKQKVQVRHFRDGVEHFGNEDPNGLF